METLTWVLTASCVLGAVLNAKKKIMGFYIWLPTNLVWAAVAWYKDLPAQAVLFIVYTVIAIIGIINWRKTNG